MLDRGNLVDGHIEDVASFKSELDANA